MSIASDYIRAILWNIRLFHLLYDEWSWGWKLYSNASCDGDSVHRSYLRGFRNYLRTELLLCQVAAEEDAGDYRVP